MEVLLKKSLICPFMYFKNVFRAQAKHHVSPHAQKCTFPELGFSITSVANIEESTNAIKCVCVCHETSVEEVAYTVSYLPLSKSKNGEFFLILCRKNILYF